jgi:hypothetical protein
VHRATAVTLVALALAVSPAAAEHTVYYRYVVLGFVKDAQNQRVAGRPVEVVRDKTGLAYAGRTNDEGLFVIVVRLGDESDGETLTLRVGAARTTIRVRFDPANHTDDRGTRVDLDGTRFTERAAAFRPTLVRYVGSERH